MTEPNHTPGATIRLNSLRRVLLLHPLLLPQTLVLFVTSVIFTVWPQSLEHDAMAFEQRGVIHHVWHYALLVGATLTLAGLLLAGRRSLRVEFIGLCLLAATMAMHTAAYVAEALIDNVLPSISGIGIALRIGVLIGVVVRAGIVVTEATVSLPSNNDEAGG